MGLDQFAYRVSFEKEGNSILESIPEDIEEEEIAYWRKNRFLHNWIEENVYLPKAKELSDEVEEFDSIYVKLNKFDLEQLREVILKDDLKYFDAPGFFFGEHDYNERMKEEDLKFIENALKAIEEGDEIYYYSWW